MSACSWAGGYDKEEKNMVPTLPLLSWELSVFVKENPNQV